MANLSDDSKQRIHCTLDKFTANAVENMAVFYEIFFTDYPQYHSMFYRVKNVPVAEIRQNEWIRSNQGPKVGAAVVDLVAKMDDGAALKVAIHTLVATPLHTKHNLTANDYLNALKNLLKTMQRCLGDEMSQVDVDAWLQLAGQLVPLIAAELKSLE